ncbi:MAG: hypothetical protein IIC50_15950 [Planctomycetes bacterium]|nr:hypothetical protein [Planctomycetota bacterium]
MDTQENRRIEARLRYHWPVWYGDSCGQSISQGQMVDVSSAAAAFTCYSHDYCPDPSQKITARFSVPYYGDDDAFEMSSFTRMGNVSRVERVTDHLNRVVLQFWEPLDFKPGEQQQSFDERRSMVSVVQA